MGKMKVIEYISTLGDGGAETLVKDYVRLMDHERFAPVIVVMRGGEMSANRRIIEENKIPVIEIFPRWNLGVRVWKKIIGWWYIPFKMRQIIIKENAEVVHMHLMVLKDMPRVGKALKNVRLFFTCHNEPKAVFGAARKKERKSAEYLIQNHRMQMIALHNGMAQELNEMFEIDNTVVVWNGIEVKRFRDLTITSVAKRKELGIPEDAYVIGNVGRFAEAKNHLFLVDVFAEVAKICSKAFLLMVGYGDSSLVEARIKEYGLGDRYLILSQRKDVNEILRAMDVFVFPSIYEGMPVALIEAQFAGLKCVISDTITREAVNTDNVLVLPLGNPQEWAKAIVGDHRSGEYCGDLSNFDMTNVINSLERLYSGSK